MHSANGKKYVMKGFEKETVILPSIIIEVSFKKLINMAK